MLVWIWILSCYNQDKEKIGGFAVEKIIHLNITFSFLFAPSALGHSRLSSSTPASGEVVKGELSSITLLFNTTVEKTSNLNVLNEDGVEIPIEEILIKQNEMIKILVSEELDLV